jgi:AcrR family transcriptional regulator
MKHPTKGELTRQNILNKVNALFNGQGVDHTISQIAASIGMGKSRVTNYFPKKEHLVLGLLKQYEEELVGIFEHYQAHKDLTDIGQFVNYLSDIMDLMFRYRGVISHAMTNPAVKSMVGMHIEENYRRNKEKLRQRLNSFSKNGLVEGRILEPEYFEVFSVQFLTLASNWIISYTLMDPDKAYEAVKPVYLRSILYCLNPYLTEEGGSRMESALGNNNAAKIH